MHQPQQSRALRPRRWSRRRRASIRYIYVKNYMTLLSPRLLRGKGGIRIIFKFQRFSMLFDQIKDYQ